MVESMMLLLVSLNPTTRIMSCQHSFQVSTRFARDSQRLMYVMAAYIDGAKGSSAFAIVSLRMAELCATIESAFGTTHVKRENQNFTMKLLSSPYVMFKYVYSPIYPLHTLFL